MFVPLSPKLALALHALYEHRDPVTREVRASLSQLCQAAQCSDTTWQTRRVPPLVAMGLLVAEIQDRGHYRARVYTLTPLGVQKAETTPFCGAETTPRGRLGVVSGSSRGRTLSSSSFLNSPEEREKETIQETTPLRENGVVSGSSPEPGVDPVLLAQALHVIAEQQKTIQGLMAKAGLMAETCSCGQVKVERTNGKTGEKFKACPLFKKCPHYVKTESPAVESARRASQAARETAARLQATAGPQKIDPFSVLSPRRVS